jgi:hypothetical protein
VRTRMEVMLRVEANCQPGSDQIADHLVALAGYSGELSMYEPTTHANRRSLGNLTMPTQEAANHAMHTRERAATIGWNATPGLPSRCAVDWLRRALSSARSIELYRGPERYWHHAMEPVCGCSNGLC